MQGGRWSIRPLTACQLARIGTAPFGRAQTAVERARRFASAVSIPKLNVIAAGGRGSCADAGGVWLTVSTFTGLAGWPAMAA